MKLKILWILLWCQGCCSNVFADDDSKETVTIYTYRTEGWRENDTLGAGYHVSWDKIPPNIWVEVGRYQSSERAVVGIPNDSMAGGSVNSGYWLARDYLLTNLYTRIPFNLPLCTQTPEGSCQNSDTCRCYGDWINLEPLLDGRTADYPDREGLSFLNLPPQIHGQKRTRYQFTVFVQDNTPFWFKDPDGGYDKNKLSSKVKYFPFEKLVIRLCCSSNPAGGDGVPSLDSDEENPETDEYYLLKQGEDFRMDRRGEDEGIYQGNSVYHLSFYHTFKFEQEYLIQVTAQDMEGNRRTLRVPLSIGELSGISVRGSSKSRKSN
jgi:hypothetical protein